MDIQALPRSVRPRHYDLQIEPHIERATFDGSVIIEVETVEPTSLIIINAHTLAIRSTTLYDGEGNPIKISDTGGDSTLQTFSIVLEQPLPSKSHLFIHQTFSGFIDKTGLGLHATEVHGSSMLSTFLEPSHARTVFPCFDEPCFKAAFRVSLIVPGHMTCLGNMPIKSETETLETSRGKKRVEFHHTAPMSTYLVAFAVGEFDMIELNDFRIPIRAYAPPEYDIEHCIYALGVAARVLAIYEQMFKLDCGLEKLDILAVPVSVGAMENRGLVTVSTTILFIGPDSTEAEKMACAQLISHEIAHQWFGNLVTMSSWQDYWLKEALADWAETMAQEELLGWPSWQDFVSDKMQKALVFDSSRFGHPLVAPDTPLDPVTYGKGASVLRMLAGFVGNDVFLQAVRRFLLQNAYGNGDPEDLWEILSQIHGSNIRDVMQIWTTKAGYPVINIKESEKDGTIKLTQTPFLAYKTINENTAVYPIFLEVITHKRTIKERLEAEPKVIKVPLDFYKLNPGQIRYYLVAYPISRLQKLGEEVRKGTLSIEDRISLITDTTALALAGHLSLRTSDLLNLLQTFEDETNFFVWRSIIGTLREISKRLLFEDQMIRNAFIDFHRQLVRKCLYRKGKLEEQDSVVDLRFKALLFGNSGGDGKVAAAAQSIFERFVAGDEKVLNPNIRAEVFESVLKGGGRKEYNQLYNKLAASSGSTQRDIMRCLGYSQNISCIKKTIKLATSPEMIADVGLLPALQALTTHKKGIYALWRFISSGAWEKMPGLTLEKIMLVGSMVLDCLTKSEYCDVARKYLQSMDDGVLGMDAEMCLEGIEIRAAWLERDRDDLIQWLRRKGYYTHGPTRISRSLSGVVDALEFLGCM